jgi:hypothetical protein
MTPGYARLVYVIFNVDTSPTFCSFATRNRSTYATRTVAGRVLP